MKQSNKTLIWLVKSDATPKWFDKTDPTLPGKDQLENRSFLRPAAADRPKVLWIISFEMRNESFSKFVLGENRTPFPSVTNSNPDHSTILDTDHCITTGTD